jgi:hypothetical protein
VRQEAREYLGSIVLDGIALFVGFLGDYVFGWKDPLTIVLVLIFAIAALVKLPWTATAKTPVTTTTERRSFLAGDSEGDDFQSIKAVNVDTFVDGSSRKSRYRDIYLRGRKGRQCHCTRTTAKCAVRQLFGCDRCQSAMLPSFANVVRACVA